MKKINALPFGVLLAVFLLFISTACDKIEGINCKDGNNKVTVFATGLNNPRGLKFGPDGNLYVAEGGAGGTNSTVGQCAQIEGLGPEKGSDTGGRISRINHAGVRTTVTDKLPSSQTNEETGALVTGVADVAFTGNTLYALLAGAGCSHGVASMPNGVFRINADGSSTMIANTSAFLQANPVKDPHFGPGFEPDGTPYSMISEGGDFYVVEPNQDQLFKVTTSGTTSRVADITASQGHIVSTVVAYRNGNFYIGNLGLFPIVEGSSKIIKVSPSGQIEVVATGFTAILGVVFDDQGRLYVLETSVGAPFPAPGKGQVVRLDPSGKKETIALGLSMPTGITLGPDGQLYVSNVGFGPSAVGGGQVLKIDVRTCKHVNQSINPLFGSIHW